MLVLSYVDPTPEEPRVGLGQKVLEVLGKICVRCGFDDNRALQIDHIHGGGSKHIKSTSWFIRYKQVLNDPSDFQLLCANCNWIKRAENKEVRERL